jgi:hypothetical protein
MVLLSQEKSWLSHASFVALKLSMQAASAANATSKLRLAVDKSEADVVMMASAGLQKSAKPGVF